MKIDDIRGAIARGWCSVENEKKVMDPELAEAITFEIVKILGINDPLDATISRTIDGQSESYPIRYVINMAEDRVKELERELAVIIKDYRDCPESELTRDALVLKCRALEAENKRLKCGDGLAKEEDQ